MSKQSDELSTALHQAIGANTRTILGRVVAVRSDGRVTAFSENFGNLEVVVGNIRWLRVGDVIFILRAAPEEKYQPNLYIGYAGNLDGYTPGSPAQVIANTTATVTDLPTEDDGTRLGDIRVVGGTVNVLTGTLEGAQTYIYAQTGNGTREWIGLGSGVSTSDTQLMFLGHMTTGTFLGGSAGEPTFAFDGVEQNPRSITHGTGSVIASTTTPTGDGWSLILPQAGTYEISAAVYYGPAGSDAPGRWPAVGSGALASLYKVDTQIYLVSSLPDHSWDAAIDFDTWGVLDYDQYVTFSNTAVVRVAGTFTGHFEALERIWVAARVVIPGSDAMITWPNTYSDESFKSWLSVKYIATS